MSFIEMIFQSLKLYINDQLTSGNDLAEFARHVLDNRICVLAQRAVIIDGQAKIYITTN